MKHYKFELIINMINNLNQELFDKYGELTNLFSYSTNGFIELISFNDETLWNSEDDERIFNEDENDYEPIETFIRRVYNIYLDKLNELRL